LGGKKDEINGWKKKEEGINVREKKELTTGRGKRRNLTLADNWEFDVKISCIMLPFADTRSEVCVCLF
jgi:hypothetical protein